EIPMWLSEFSDVIPYHEEMASEVDRLLESASGDADSPTLGHQTASDPFLLPSLGWRVLERATNEAFSKVIRTSLGRRRTGEFHVRRWALRLGRLTQSEKTRLDAQGLHNHLPALLSSVYYLRVPSELAEQREGGTIF